ncbi:DUF2197 domain-containing protein [Sulfobacillus sp. DSM 109850]|uniref:DUF2197 domain-containing protein n=1 Tax=Sulfobacillus harzensis TaxID=2729629 RepID=A0A7Y0L7D3_9FIRM|nr:DUF2197 domain-containing protein [Sulfobacillus harzensis]
MTVRCIVCGTASELPAWAKFAEELKVHPEHARAFVCPSCRLRLESDAKSFSLEKRFVVPYLGPELTQLQHM